MADPWCLGREMLDQKASASLFCNSRQLNHLVTTNRHIHTDIFTLPLVGVQTIVMSMSVCPSICLSVYSHTSKLQDNTYTNFFCMLLWPWLDPPLMAI